MAFKNWYLTISARPDWDVKRRDGRHAPQVSAAVRTTSKKEAARLFDVTLYEFNQYASETWNDETIKALDSHPPGTVLIHGDLVGDTIDGQRGWVVRPPTRRN